MTSPTQRPLPEDTQHSQQTDINHPGGIRAAVPTSERPQTHALYCAVTGVGIIIIIIIIRDNEKRTCILIDVAISGDSVAIKKEAEKI